MSGIGRKTWLVERHIVQYQFVQAETAEEAVIKADRNNNPYGQGRHATPWAEDQRARDTKVRLIGRAPAKRQQHR